MLHGGERVDFGEEVDLALLAVLHSVVRCALNRLVLSLIGVILGLFLRVIAQIIRLFPFFLRLLLDLDPEIVTVGRGLDHLEDAVLDFNAFLGHKNEARVLVCPDLLLERPSCALDR